MKSSLTLLCLLSLSTPLLAQTHDDFETYAIVTGGAEAWGGFTFFDETTVFPNGNGPNLVADGCTYSTNGSSIQWNGDTYFGLQTVTVMGSGTDFTLTYDVPANSLSFTLQTFNGYSEVATVTLYDASNAVIQSTPGISVPNATPVPFSYSGSPVAKVVIVGLASWGPIIDDHIYDSGPSGPQYAITGLVGGGSATLTVSGATAGGGVLIGYSLSGAGPTATPFGPVDMSPPITQMPVLTANGAGVAAMTTGVPNRASGFTVYSQAADLSSAALSNSLAQVVL
jgi:hypothetical protein